MQGTIESALFQGWGNVLHTVFVGILAYIGLVAVLRTSGKRTLAKLNAFDLVVTVALGSCLASVLLSRDTALVQGLAAFVTLVGMQYAVAWLSVRSSDFAHLVRSEASLLVRDGKVLHGAMKRARVTEDELSAVIRSSGTPDPRDVAAVILESDGSFSVLPQGAAGDVDRIEDLGRMQHA